MSEAARALRDSLGRFATGVSVVTAARRDGVAFGMTVNSFASLSLNPPLVLWNLQRDSECLADFEAASHYAVNVLRADQQALSTRYTRQGAHELDAGDATVGGSGCPVLATSLACFECELRTHHPGGDHIIMIGAVVHHRHSEGLPLLFYSGHYGQLAEAGQPVQ